MCTHFLSLAHTHIHAYTSVHTHPHMHTFVHTYTHTCKHILTRTHAHTHSYAHTHAHVQYMCIHIPSLALPNCFEHCTPLEPCKHKLTLGNRFGKTWTEELEYVPGFVGQGAKSATKSQKSKAPLYTVMLPYLISATIVPLVTCSTKIERNNTNAIKSIQLGAWNWASKHTYRMIWWNWWKSSRPWLVDQEGWPNCRSWHHPLA